MLNKFKISLIALTVALSSPPWLIFQMVTRPITKKRSMARKKKVKSWCIQQPTPKPLAH